MKKYFPIYGIAYAVLLCVMVLMLCLYPKAELHLMLNSCHTKGGDMFMRLYSQLAEWPLYLVAALPLVVKRWRITAFYAVSELTSATVVWVLKQLFRAPRPATFFESIPDVVLPVVEGVRLHHSNSFPSGHTATFFVFFTVCALLSAQRFDSKQSDSSRFLPTALMCLLLMAAALGGYSRIYLSQHFLGDVCVGSLIGVIIPTLLFVFFAKRFKL